MQIQIVPCGLRKQQVTLRVDDATMTWLMANAPRDVTPQRIILALLHALQKKGPLYVEHPSTGVK